MRKIVFAAAGLALGPVATAAAQTPIVPPADPAAQARADAALGGWTSDRLRPFGTEQAFVRYLRDVRTAARAHRLGWAGSGRIQFAQAGQPDTPPQPLCPPEDPDCIGMPDQSRQSDQTIVVTGTLFRSPNMAAAISPISVANNNGPAAPGASITNNQVAAVDEGDIVKQIGRHLLVLQDGRIFAVDTQGGRGRRLTITDRADIYRDPHSDAWYDEMVVYGRRVVITGYSYDQRVSEIAVFELGETGRLARLGTFHIASNDYYSGDNYSTRLVGDRLVLYAPIDLAEIDPEQPIRWPRFRRVDAAGDRAGREEGRPLLDAGAIYRPTLTSWAPVLHMITTCRLGLRARQDPGCRSTGFVASYAHELFVSPAAAYLWTARSLAGEMGRDANDYCGPDQSMRLTDSLTARIYRLPIMAGPPGVAAAYGIPLNQLGMDAGRGRFRALVATRPEGCRLEKTLPTSFFSIPDSAFSASLRPADPAAFTAMPVLTAATLENRFTDRWLVFGGRGNYWDMSFGDDEAVPGPATVVAVPLDRPDAFQLLSAPHGVLRAERVGDDIVLTGYRADDGLSISLVRLRENLPKIADTILLPGRYESEGRSHAFNAVLDADGGALMGLPTVLRLDDAARWWWRSGPSDVSFARLDPSGRLSRAGTLRSSRRSDEERPDFTRDGEGHNGYRCEVSCVDWYGNTRPIFTGGRVFALTATELVEGRLTGDDRIEEVQRLDLTAAVGSGAARTDGRREVE